MPPSRPRHSRPDTQAAGAGGYGTRPEPRLRQPRESLRPQQSPEGGTAPGKRNIKPGWATPNSPARHAQPETAAPSQPVVTSVAPVASVTPPAPQPAVTPVTPPAPARALADSRGRRNTKIDPLGAFGEVLMTLGVLALLFAFWDVYWTNIQSGRQQTLVSARLEEQWEDRNPRPLTAPSEGTAFARLYVPRFGSDFNFSVVKGVSDEDLEKGPGHYMDTQDPGAVGNFAMAGHRVGRGAPFNDLGLLNTCDSIVVETAGAWNIYKVLPIDVPEEQRQQALEECLDPELAVKMSTGAYANVSGRYITTPHDVNVINPIPGQESQEVHADDAAILTMTTCHPQFSNAERMIVHAVLVRSDPKSPGFVPEEMTRGV